IQVFSNDAPDPSGFGEGKTLVGTFTVPLSKIKDEDSNDIFVAEFVMTANISDKFLSATATDPAGNTSEFSFVDSDGDALADAWETKGIDVNEDGNLDFVLGGSDPNRKDVYVEIDAMTGREPSNLSLLNVQDAFLAAPAELVQNPDGERGINLVLDL